jgi:ZIP family zinc transporter
LDVLIIGLLLALFAGLSTTLGCIFSFFVKEPNPKFISLIMGFSAGVMILVSFVELLQHGIESIGFNLGILFFFVGMISMLLIDVSVSHEYEFEDSIEMLTNEKRLMDPYHHRHYRHRDRHNEEINRFNLERTSKFVFLGVFIHNIPEGIATFISTVEDVQLGIILAIAIALHNIPEGIAVSVPVYAYTNDRKKAFFWSFSSGISEFLGALLIGLILYPFINDFLLGAMLAIVAGIMIYISLDELLPVSHSIGKEHIAILGLIAGMSIMAVSLILFGN